MSAIYLSHLDHVEKFTVEHFVHDHGIKQATLFCVSRGLIKFVLGVEKGQTSALGLGLLMHFYSKSGKICSPGCHFFKERTPSIFTTAHS